MTTRFRQVADEIPVVAAPALSPGFFDRARRLHRLRQVTFAGAALVLFVLGGLGLVTTIMPQLPQPADDPGRVPLPSDIIDVPKLLADIRSAPLDRVLIIFAQDDRLVLVGKDNSFRDLPWAGTDEVNRAYLLSPDGRNLAMIQGQDFSLLDLTTGRQHDLPGEPRTWSSDGRQLAVATDDGFIVMDAGTMTTDWAITLSRSDNCAAAAGFTAVFSPDARKFAVFCGGAIDIYQRSGPKTSFALPAGITSAGRYSFAGQRAWHPGGRNIMLQNSSNKVYHFDSQTGGGHEEDLYQRWRSSVALWPYIVDWWQGNPVFSDGRGFVTIEDRPRQSVDDINGRGAQVAAQIVDWSHTRPPAEPEAGPLLLRLHDLSNSATQLAGIILLTGLIIVAAILKHRRNPQGRRQARSK